MSKELASDRELYEYLIALRDTLVKRGAPELSARVDRASRYFGGLPTEFMGESMVALRAVYQQSNGLMEPGELDQLVAVLHQVERS